MYKLYPYFTKDGSVGLFSPSDDDIYHSTYGAATEAYEKFIFPAEIDKFLLYNPKIKVLDICFGIGYNSKSFINFIFKNKKKYLKKCSNKRKILSLYSEKIDNDNINYKKYNETLDNDNNILKEYTDKIYIDNISNEKNIQSKQKYNYQIYNDKISTNTEELQTHTQNKQSAIYIKAIDTDKILAWLSPFIENRRKKIPKNYKIPFSNEKILKLLNSEGKSGSNENSPNHKNQNLKYNIKELINYPAALNLFLYNEIIASHPEIADNDDLICILNNKEFRQYFNPHICRLYKFYRLSRGKNTPLSVFYPFLHNIYYNYLSNRYKSELKCLKNMDINFELKINDARKEISEDKNMYDYIFLDAFTAAKCPCLWTVDFFKLLYNHLEPNGMILTYSNSAAVRNAFLNAGFYVGKIYNPSADKFTGTIAVKNEALIKHELSEYDLGLLKTRAGIFYRDKNLSALNEEIIALHKKEVENSNLISSSKYIKLNK